MYEIKGDFKYTVTNLLHINNSAILFVSKQKAKKIHSIEQYAVFIKSQETLLRFWIMKVTQIHLFFSFSTKLLL